MQDQNISDASKVILLSSKLYDSQYETILRILVNRGIELFCAVGVDCEKWEDTLDWLCVEEDIFIVTTSHPNETLEQVEEFARQWESKKNSKLQIIEI